MRHEDLVRFAHELEHGDLSLAAALRELVARERDGRVERIVWVPAVQEALAQVAEELGSHGLGTASAADGALTDFLELRVIPGLERAGLARRDREGGAWTALQLDAELAGDLPEHREAVLSVLDGTLRKLSRARAAAYAPTVEAATDGGSRLWAEGLTKVYKRRRVVNEVDIAVRQGEIVGLLGPNGAGKTTTFYMMVGLIPPNAGSVHLDEEDLTRTPMYRRARKGVGYLAQEPSIFRKLTVEQNVLAILETLSLPRQEEKHRLEELLGELGLSGLRESKAYSLSGGERRRLEITRALVQRPKFMLLDEPFAGIDPIAVNDIQQIVRGLKGRGIGVIITDHNVEQTLEIVDRAYIMYEGRIRVSGTVSELVWSPEVSEIYLGPTLTARMRQRFPEPDLAVSGSPLNGMA